MSTVSSWVSLLKPDIRLNESILQLTPALLDQHQLKGLVLDVDDTLVSSKATDVSPELLDWLIDIKQNAKVSLVSNNINRSRIHRIAKSLDLSYIHGAGKPSRRKLRKAVSAMGLPHDQVAMVGDRLFTDVLAGNRLGLFTILVEPMSKGSMLRKFELWIYQTLKKCLV